MCNPLMNCWIYSPAMAWQLFKYRPQVLLLLWWHHHQSLGLCTMPGGVFLGRYFWMPLRHISWQYIEDKLMGAFFLKAQIHFIAVSGRWCQESHVAILEILVPNMPFLASSYFWRVSASKAVVRTTNWHPFYHWLVPMRNWPLFGGVVANE